MIRGANPLLVESFTADVVVSEYNALVQGTEEGHATTTTTQNATGFLGFTLDEAETVGYSVPVCSIGTALGVASQAIAVGDPVILSATAGYVDPASALASGTPNVIGYARTSAAAAGDRILIKIA